MSWDDRLGTGDGIVPKPPRVLVVASVMVDLTAFMDRIPDGGETLRGNSFTIGFGGKGANQAVMAARLGAEVDVVACVGDDQFAAAAAANLGNVGVKTTILRHVPNAATGVATIWVDGLGQNRIVVVPGANSSVSAEQVDTAFDQNHTPNVVVCQLETPIEAAQRAMERAREADAITVFNPAPAREIPAEVLRLATWIVPNEVEFEALQDQVLGHTRPRDIHDAIIELAQALETAVVITLGEHGALIYENRSSVDGPEHVSAPSVEVTDTTGAGDAFIGAFAYALGRGATGVEAARFGCLCASDTVTRPGTQTSFREINSALLDMADSLGRRQQDRAAR